MPLIVSDADLYKEPGSDHNHPCDPSNQLTIGDLHGNALKLIYFLLRQNVLRLPAPDDYAKLVAIYRKNQLTAEDLACFEVILASMEVNPVGTVRLIGDELADRGQNDYLTLKVIDLLRRKGVSVEILLSNHSAEFIAAYETTKKFNSYNLNYGDARSMYALGKLIKDGIVSQEEVFSLIDNCYKPFLRALSYTLSQDKTKITIYSHAAIDLCTIEQLTKVLGVDYRDDEIEDLARTIDSINSKFYNYVKNNKAHTLYLRLRTAQGKDALVLKHDENPFVFLMWNRRYTAINRPAKYKNYSLNFVHGHDDAEESHENIYNLDNLLGKNEFFVNGEYTIHFSQDNPAPILEPYVSAEAQAQAKVKSELFDKICKMEEYGNRLREKDRTKANEAIELSEELERFARAYFENPKPTSTFEEFKGSFLELLHSKDAIMNKHRALWRPIVLNIVIALTGVGLFVLAGKLVQSKITTGKCSLFCTTTKRERQVNKIEKIVDKLNPSK